MFPTIDLFGMKLDSYTVLLSVGVVICMIFIRILADRRKMRGKLQNLILFNAIAAVVLGYGSAVLFQAFYNFMATGKFEIVQNTGATFYGGLIGGTALFIIIYFVVGRFLYPDKYHVEQFRAVSDLAPAAITVAHAFGRLGCLMAGCCHGRVCDVWYAVPMDIPRDGTSELVNAIPVQYFEALFLFTLSAYLFVSFWKGLKYQMPIYMTSYAVWRFVAEIWRDDYRGETVVNFLTPSQLISILLLVGGLVLLGIEIYLDVKKKNEEAAPVAVSAAETDVPAAETDVPAAETDVPAAETDAPAAETDVPASETDVPASETDVPASETDVPASEADVPASETEVPASETDVPTATDGELHE
jgi:phosphatidylglycerol:prolipoprotein diacylglycerol transferase